MNADNVIVGLVDILVVLTVVIKHYDSGFITFVYGTSCQVKMLYMNKRNKLINSRLQFFFL